METDNQQNYTVSQKTRQLWQHRQMLILFGKVHQHTFKKRNAYSTFLIRSLLFALFAVK